MGYARSDWTTDADADGMYRVTVGDGEWVAPEDEDLKRLCHILHGIVQPLSPEVIYAYVVAGDYECDIHGGDTFAPPGTLVVRRGEGYIRPTGLVDVSQQLVQYYWEWPCDTTTDRLIGHPRDTLRFETHDMATMAHEIDRVHNIGTMNDVWALLCRACDETPMSWGIVSEHKFRTNLATDGPCICGEDGAMQTRVWMDLTLGISANATAVSTLSVCVSSLQTLPPMAFTVDLVHRQWMREGETSAIVPRSASMAGWKLHFVPHAVHGGHVEMTVPPNTVAWPIWVRECRLADAMRFPRISPARDATSRGIRKRTIDISVIDCGDAKCRKVISHWSKSNRTVDVDAPYLLGVRKLDAYADAAFEHDNLRATRQCTRDAIQESAAYGIFTERFGSEYASGVLDRCANDDHVGVYAVHDLTTDTTVAAYSVVLYDCILDDGVRSVCLMVDSFAVLSSRSGSGVGGAAFHHMLRALPERHGCSRYAVFAQCIRRGDAQRFWNDKLDDSSVARSLMLQALALDANRVPIHSEAQCSPRSRLFRVREL